MGYQETQEISLDKLGIFVGKVGKFCHIGKVHQDQESLLGKFLLHIRKILPQKTGSWRQKHFCNLALNVEMVLSWSKFDAQTITRTQVLERSARVNWALWSGLEHFVFVFVCAFVIVFKWTKVMSQMALQHIYIRTETLEFLASLSLYLSLSLSSLDSVCHQLSENIWFDRLAVVLG